LLKHSRLVSRSGRGPSGSSATGRRPASCRASIRRPTGWSPPSLLSRAHRTSRSALGTSGSPTVDMKGRASIRPATGWRPVSQRFRRPDCLRVSRSAPGTSGSPTPVTTPCRLSIRPTARSSARWLAPSRLDNARRASRSARKPYGWPTAATTPCRASIRPAAGWSPPLQLDLAHGLSRSARGLCGSPTTAPTPSRASIQPPGRSPPSRLDLAHRASRPPPHRRPASGGSAWSAPPARRAATAPGLGRPGPMFRHAVPEPGAGPAPGAGRQTSKDAPPTRTGTTRTLPRSAPASSRRTSSSASKTRGGALRGCRGKPARADERQDRVTHRERGRLPPCGEERCSYLAHGDTALHPGVYRAEVRQRRTRRGGDGDTDGRARRQPQRVEPAIEAGPAGHVDELGLGLVGDLGTDSGEHLVTQRSRRAAPEHPLDVGGTLTGVHDRQGVRLVGRIVMAQGELVAALDRRVPRAEPQVRENLRVDMDVLGARRADRFVLGGTARGKREHAAEGDRGYRRYPSDA